MFSISIVTINKNNSEGLEKTITSVVNQSFSDYEFIVIDGGSTDNSLSVINKYSHQIHCWISEPDSGIYQAMNKGIAKVTGKYIIFMNSGDCFFSSNTLANVFSEYQDADILVGTAVTEGRWLKQRSFLPRQISFYELATYHISHQATFIKKQLFDELGGYDESLKLVSDWKFILLALNLHSKTLKPIKQDISVVEHNGVSTQKGNEQIMKKEKEDTLKKYFPYIYTDFLTLHRIKKFSLYHIKVYVIWRLRHILIG